MKFIEKSNNISVAVVQWPYTTHGQCTTAAQPTAAEGQQKKGLDPISQEAQEMQTY